MAAGSSSSLTAQARRPAALPAGCCGSVNAALEGSLRTGDPCPNACADALGTVLLEPGPASPGYPGELSCPACGDAFGLPRP